MAMFNNNKKSATSGSVSINSLVKDCVVTGNVTSELDIRIDGTIKGNLKCKAKVVIGEEGKVEGDIHCQNALIEGAVEGNIKCQLLMDVREKAKIEGDIECAKLIIEDGAYFNGSCKMELGHGLAG
jgi:cytoskeletal protein CcmA (bactofilin family)